MEVNRNNINFYNTNSRRIGFKSDVAISPIPGMVLPGEDYDDNTQDSVPPQNNLPDIYYMPDTYKREKTFVEKLKKVDLMGFISPWFEHPLLTAGTAVGVSAGIDALDKACNKEYEKSIVGKAAKFGDKIEQSNLIQKEGVQKFFSGIGNGWKKFKAALMKNDVINSMVKTPAQPELPVPKQEFRTMDSYLVERFKGLSVRLGLVPNDSKLLGGFKVKELQLKDLVLDGKEEEYIKNIFNVKNISKAPREEAVSRIMLQRLGRSEAEISSFVSSNGSLAKELLKTSGLTAEQLEKIFRDEAGSKEVIELVDKACANLKNLKVANGKFVLPGKIQPFANIESPLGIHNRISSKTLGAGAKTKTGQFMSKLVQELHQILTFRGTSKVGALFWMVPFLVGAVLNTIKADKKEKLGTAVTGLVDTFAWVVTFPLAVKLVYYLGGMQYAGMGEAKVNELKEIISKFNARTLADNPEKFKSLAEYKNAKKELNNRIKELCRVDNQNFLTRTLRKISKFTKSDLLKIESYKGGSAVGNFFRKIPNKMKDLFLGRGRFLFVLFATVPLVDNIVRKITKKIVGNSYEEMKESEMLAAKEQQEVFTMSDLKSRMIEIQNNKLNSENSVSEDINQDDSANVNPKDLIVPASMLKMAENAKSNNVLDNNDKIIPDIISEEPISETDLNNSTKEPQTDIPANGSIPSQKIPSEDNMIQPEPKIEESVAKIKRDNYTYIPSSENILKQNNPLQQANKYIPAQTAVKFNKTFDNSGLEAALRRADRAERRAINTLAGNFGQA